MQNPDTAILLWSSEDKKGLVSRISQFIFERGGNIIDLDEHVNQADRMFFIRVEWDLNEFNVPKNQIEETFAAFANKYNARWTIRFSNTQRRIAIFVSKQDHCLQEILWRNKLKEFDAEICLIISNHKDLEFLGQRYSIPFYLFPMNDANKNLQEEKEIELLKKENIDTIILARYMQVLSPQFVLQYPYKIINIHHSFLPAFAGSNPYKQAYERGVKIIGATCHYVTDILDEGPIIGQDIIRVTHKDSVDDLIRKGRDLERLVLARGLRYHLQERILVYKNKTVVFE